MADMKFGIHFGLLSEPLSEQLTSQGLLFDEAAIKLFQDDSEAILSLWMSDYMNDTQKNKMQDKLFRDIQKHIMAKNKLKKKVD